MTGYKTMTGKVPVAAIDTDGNPDTPDATYIGNGRVSETSVTGETSSSSQSKSAAPRNSKKRYHYSNAKIDDIEEKIEDKEREIERAVGEAKIQAMEELAAL
jgi:hypothetical protein